MNMKRSSREYFVGSRHQTGVIATLLAIIVLVATLLAAVALMRSLDTSNTIAGSLAFRQSVIQEAALAYVNAKTTIKFNEPASDTDNGAGYYAELQTSSAGNKGIPDLLVSQVSSPTCVTGIVCLNTSGTTGNNVYYMVERLCPAAGAVNANNCSVPTVVIVGGSSSNQTTDAGAPFNAGAGAAFRLSVLVVGPKQTLGYVQSILR
jgi:type IV pilus assembly protein PilX